MDASLTTLPRFAVGFGRGEVEEEGAQIAVPVLSEERQETLFRGLRPEGEDRGFALFASSDWLVGTRVVVDAERLEEVAESIYRDVPEILRARNRHLVRVWNYVPEINEPLPGGLEAYRAFCRGRSVGLERGGWRGALPAASAVGASAGHFAVIFAAARARPLMFENPEQVPAFLYPVEYGPRAPSFSRAAQVTADGRRWTFVSGTASIKGHASVGRGDLGAQIECTLDNLRLISRVCGLGDRLAAERPAAERHFKVYLRHAEDFPAARAALESRLLRAGDRVLWLHADICRAELLIEIEASVAD